LIQQLWGNGKLLGLQLSQEKDSEVLMTPSDTAGDVD
jgi:hypothetical protein